MSTILTIKISMTTYACNHPLPTIPSPPISLLPILYHCPSCSYTSMLSRTFRLESTFKADISKLESKFRLLEGKFREVGESKLDRQRKNEKLDRLDWKLKKIENRRVR